MHVSILATPDAQVSPLAGLYETLNAFGLLSRFEPHVPKRPFEVEVVAASKDVGRGASGLRLGAHRSYQEVKRTDIAIVPLMMVDGADWKTGRYPQLVGWLKEMHRDGAALCSTCTGVLLLAETGLLAGREATIHWAFARTFHRNFPDVRLRLEEVLITAGDRSEFVMTGGVSSWHDLALHLIAKHVGPTAAHSMARLLMLQWHSEGQSPYTVFSAQTEHGDAVVRHLQDWLHAHYMVPRPVDEMLRRSGLARRSLERRFAKATGYAPNVYVQQLRVEEAKKRLERTGKPIDQISYEVGYEDPAHFRRLFKRITQMTPGGYRRRFQMPVLQPPS